MAFPKLISVVVPAYNEGECVDELARRLRAVFDQVDRYDFEVVIVENGSVDDTYERLLKIREDDERFKIVKLSRNFLMEGGMTAGLRRASGDAAIIMSADLQDPPELIPEMITHWEDGYENVYGIVQAREGSSWFRRVCAAGFYWTINKLSDENVPRNVSDFRLVDRKVYEAFNALGERNRMVRAMFGWLGFRSIGIEYDRPDRHAGSSEYKILPAVGFAIRGIFGSSRIPLKAIPFFGMALSILSFAALVVLTVQAVFFGVPFPGFGTIVALSLLFAGFMFLLLGIVSEYVGMIFEETRSRPLYIESELFGFPDDPD
jgi:glycosyltransferase involved in cell wall biosynthesis